MSNLANYQMEVNGTKTQTATSNPNNYSQSPQGVMELRIASLRRRRRKGLDDIAGKRKERHRRRRPRP